MTSTNRTHTDQVARHRLRKWRLAVVPMALLAPLGLVACGGGDASANPTTTTASGSTQNGSTQNNTSDGRPNREAMQKYTACLSEHGVTLPDRATLLDRAAHIEARFRHCGLPARKWLRMLRPLVPQARPPAEASLP